MPKAAPVFRPLGWKPPKPWTKRDTSVKRLSGRALQARRLHIATRDLSTCYVCGRVTADGEVDHKVPLSRNGSDDDSNLGWICRVPCHDTKSKKERHDR